MNKIRPKMSREQRAKQFLPFAGVKGLDEALAMKEETIDFAQESIISEDRSQELDLILKDLTNGQKIVVEYKEGKNYTVDEKTIKKIDYDRRELITESGVILFSQIRELKTM